MSKYSLESVMIQLRRKNIKVSYNGLIYIIDISKASNVGNKTWGKIGFLQRCYDAKVIGRRSYMSQDKVEEKKPFTVKRPILQITCIFK